MSSVNLCSLTSYGINLPYRTPLLSSLPRRSTWFRGFSPRAPSAIAGDSGAGGTLRLDGFDRRRRGEEQAREHEEDRGDAEQTE
jgi:hypothetical protein